MPELTLSPIAQQWINVVLIWVGFGTLAGLLATVIFPLRRSIGPFLAMVMGIVGSTIGLLGLSWLFPDRPLNPISPLGFLAATIGAFVLLVLYRLGARCSTATTTPTKNRGNAGPTALAWRGRSVFVVGGDSSRRFAVFCRFAVTNRRLETPPTVRISTN